MALIDINWKPTDRQLRQFAALFLIAAGILGSVLYFRHEAELPAKIIWGLGAVLGPLGLLLPRLILPVYVVMMAISFPIGLVISTLLLGFVFYVVMTPIGRIMRLFGYDAMHRKPDPSAKSYWNQRSGPVPVERYFKQY